MRAKVKMRKTPINRHKGQIQKLCEELEAALKEVGVRILKGNFAGKGGWGKYKGQWILALDHNLPSEIKLKLMAEMLSMFDLSSLGISQEALSLIEKARINA
ncbi:MAG: hypothetical protein RUDDFDWM_000737 [Candidatus Fervidibacterota bacterium]